MPADVVERVRRIRVVLDDGVGVPDMPLWVQENGWVVRADQEGPGNITTEENRAIRLPETADLLVRSNCGVRNYMAHAWLTPAVDPTGFHAGYGIARPELDADGKAVLYPTALAYGEKVRELEGHGPVAPDYSVERSCPGRPDPDSDGDGVADGVDAYPADPSLTRAPAAFELDVSPSSLVSKKNADIATQVAVSSVAGWQDPVSVSVEDLPTGMAATFAPSDEVAVTPGDTGDLALVLRAGPKVRPGTDTVRVIATGGSIRDESSIVFEVLDED